ncbi:hypothetical protein GF339_16540 [candidate division KSB3 bacterium]|uniref:Uncharacterized protein n=1 Tax=candidate division KSB3 bacterium TaxID=2044937 RepID=A0A9D5JYL5_9BACT|nr:hypothetical protein [candidate division KSB3 bacterium]MBD3326197.1 hypothetical protein [candidate division KSB3 bacterium]
MAMASVQRLMMYLTPIWLLEIMCRICPKTAIGLICHWVNEKNQNVEERALAKRLINPVQVAKKLSKLSDIAILYLLKQDEHLWKMYLAGVGVIPFPVLPYMLLELMFDLGGQEGRKKVKNIVVKSRVTLGGRKQGQIMEYFKTDTVLDLFEMFSEIDVRMRLLFSAPKAVALWLDHWDLRMKRSNQPEKSDYWIGKLPGERAFEIEKLMKELEFRRKYTVSESIYDEWD